MSVRFRRRRTARWLWLLLPAAIGARSAPVEVARDSWTDKARGREIPYTAYQPAGAGAHPLILFSHGLGGTRDTYAYLGSYWASNGYLVVHLQHHGSDDAVWREASEPMKNLQGAAADYRTALDRARDVRFALDRLTGDAAWRDRVDTNRIGVAGHSFGAWTVLAAVGQRLGPLEDRLADRRIKAGLAMSSPVPPRRDDRTYAGIRVPILHMTGTRDDSPIGNTKVADRRIPFDEIAGAEQFLVTFTDGDHMIFSGRPRREPQAQDARFQDLIRRGSLAFWNAFLCEEAAAQRWLSGGGFRDELGAAGVLEIRPSGAQPAERRTESDGQVRSRAAVDVIPQQVAEPPP